MERMGNISGDREEDGRKTHVEEGSGTTSKIRPSNTSIGDLLSNGTFTEAMLKVGMVKYQVLNVHRLLPFLFIPLLSSPRFFPFFFSLSQSLLSACIRRTGSLRTADRRQDKESAFGGDVIILGL